MSYEGFEVHVCANGHRFGWDAYNKPEDRSCPHCKAKAAWSCSVDQTNGEYRAPDLEKAAPAPTCDHCHQTTGPVTYKIPDASVKAVHIGPTLKTVFLVKRANLSGAERRAWFDEDLDNFRIELEAFDAWFDEREDGNGRKQPCYSYLAYAVGVYVWPQDVKDMEALDCVERIQDGERELVFEKESDEDENL
jgi:hypothetical protein